ncbi:MAG: SIS domain-containing protein [Legionellales bacterium]|nr:SIS domain-containing protein [Legionellales bacterium]
MKQDILQSLQEAQSALNNLINDESIINKIDEASEIIVNSIKQGGQVFSCGNGGSLCDAMHFAEELSGKFREPRKPLPAIAISDPAHITCVGNDFGFEYIFSRFLESNSKKNDVLFCLSTSGESNNIMQAIETARKLGMKIIALTGRAESSVTSSADLAIVTATNFPYSDRIQELHIKVIHIIIEIIEKKIFKK